MHRNPNMSLGLLQESVSVNARETELYIQSPVVASGDVMRERETDRGRERQRGRESERERERARAREREKVCVSEL